YICFTQSIAMKKTMRIYTKKLFLLLPLLIGCLSLSSCFEFVEQIDLNHTGSGTIKATLNISKSRTKVASLLKMKQIHGIEVPSEATIRQEMEKVAQTLRSTSGIQNVQYQLDFNNYIATLSCSFDNVQALNDFSQTLSDRFKTQLTSYNSYRYDNATQTFTRSYTYTPSLAKQFSKIPNDDRDLFADANYTKSSLLNKEIRSQKHQNTNLSANKRATLLKVKATDLNNGKAYISNTITLVK